MQKQYLQALLSMGYFQQVAHKVRLNSSVCTSWTSAFTFFHCEQLLSQFQINFCTVMHYGVLAQKINYRGGFARQFCRQAEIQLQTMTTPKWKDGQNQCTKTGKKKKMVSANKGIQQRENKGDRIMLHILSKLSHHNTNLSLSCYLLALLTDGEISDCPYRISKFHYCNVGLFLGLPSVYCQLKRCL